MKYTEELDKVSYCFGLSIASNLLSSGVNTINTEAFVDAIRTVYAGQMPEIKPEEANQILQDYFNKLQNERGKAAKEAGEQFLKDNKSKEGVVTLKSGLQYKVISTGNGAIPKSSDTVKCHYEGRLINGAVFDSSIRRGEPAEFPVNGVIAGWVEALQLMPVGSKWQLYIPSDLAYGPHGAGQAIGPNETLIFDIELFNLRKTMNAKNLILGLSVAAIGLSSCCNTSTKTNVSLKNEADTASFYIGYMYGSNITGNGIEEINMDAIIAGMNSALQKKDAPADMMQMNMFLQKYTQKAMMAKAEKALKAGEEFLAANAKKDGIKTTESGLQYKIEKEGTGAIPADSSVVRVHYKGTLIDGTEFDSSYKRGEPTEFPVNRVIKGWTEALQLMPVGSKWTLYIPSNLAYGPQGARGAIGPNETLIFEVELIDIVDPNAQK